MFLGFGNHNAEDTVLHVCLDSVLVYASGEAEGASELSYASFRDPVLALILWLLRLLLLCCYGSSVVGSIFILNCGPVVVMLFAALGDGAGRLRTFYEFARRGAGCVRPLGMAFDGQSLRVCKLDLDVLLLDAREFAVQLICIDHLPHIKSRLKGFHVASAVMFVATRGLCVGVEVIKEAEEGSE